MKLLSILLVISICLGSFSFLGTMRWLEKWTSNVTEALNDVTGLLGIDDAFRIDTVGNISMSNTYRFRDEVVMLSDIINISGNTFADMSNELLTYDNNMSFDSCSDKLWELKIQYVSSIDNNTYVYYIPCLRAYYNDAQYLILDPINSPYIVNGYDFRVQIYYRDILNNLHSKVVSSNILQYQNDKISVASIDKAYNVELSFKSNFIINWFGHLFNRLKNNDYKYYEPTPIDGIILSTRYTVDDYFNGGYVYKSAYKVLN